jgi:hypothetical protein
MDRLKTWEALKEMYEEELRIGKCDKVLYEFLIKNAQDEIDKIKNNIKNESKNSLYRAIS